MVVSSLTCSFFLNRSRRDATVVWATSCRSRYGQCLNALFFDLLITYIRNGNFHALLRRRNGLRIHQPENPLFQRPDVPREQGRIPPTMPVRKSYTHYWLDSGRENRRSFGAYQPSLFHHQATRRNCRDIFQSR